MLLCDLIFPLAFLWLHFSRGICIIAFALHIGRLCIGPSFNSNFRPTHIFAGTPHGVSVDCCVLWFPLAFICFFPGWIRFTFMWFPRSLLAPCLRFGSRSERGNLKVSQTILLPEAFCRYWKSLCYQYALFSNVTFSLAPQLIASLLHN